MKKRIVLFLLAVFTMIGVTACKKDPYSKMSLTVDTTEVNLSLVEVDNEIVSDGVGVVSVQVDAPKGISSDIVLPTFGDDESLYGNEYVSINKKTFGDGSYQLEFTAKKQGYTEIQVKTQEGYLSKTIAINIDVALKSLSFKESANVVIEIGASYDLNLYGKSLLNFVPSYTTQTNVRFDIVGNHSYAKIENGVLSIDPKATIDNFGNNKLKIVATSLDNQDIYIDNTHALQVQVIKPLDLSFSNRLGRTLTAQLIDKENSSIFISQIADKSNASNVYYELVFANPDVDSMEEGADLKAIFGGQLCFILDRGGYKITCDNGDADCVSIVSGNTNIEEFKQYFVINSRESGEHNAVFKVDYVGNTNNGQYDGLYTKYINVKIKVVSLPTSKTILINDKNYIQGENVVAVYDTYAIGIGSRLNITSTNNSDMTFKYADVMGVEVIFDGNTVNSGTLFKSGDTLYLKVADGIEVGDPNATMTVTLTVKISNEYYTDLNGNIVEQTYSVPIYINLNLITGLSSLTIKDMTGQRVENHGQITGSLDIIADKDGRILHEFSEGIIAESVVESVRYGNNKLFSYYFGTGENVNKIYIAPAPYTPGDKTLNEGQTNLIIYLTNGIRSYNKDEGEDGRGDTLVRVQATYEINASGKPIVITNLDDSNAGFLAYRDFNYDNDKSLNFRDNEIRNCVQIDTYRNIQYNHFENIVIANYSTINLDLYKLFMYQNEEGYNEIGYVNVNTLRVESSDPSIVQWYDGKLVTYNKTTVKNSTHEAVDLVVYDGNDGILTISVFVCKRVGRVALEQQHFDLYDGSNNLPYVSLNEVYSHKAKANLYIKVWALGEDGVFEQPITAKVGDGNIGLDFGNFFNSYNMVGNTDIVNMDYPEILRKNLLKLENGELTAEFNGSLTAGENLGTILEHIYENNQNFTYIGKIRQFGSEFVVEFTVDVELPISSSSLVANVDEVTGVYFEHDETPVKTFAVNYTIFPNNTTFRDVFVQVNASNGDLVPVVIFNNEYKINEKGEYVLDADNKKIQVYKVYAYGFDAELFNLPIVFDETKGYYVKEDGSQVTTIIDDISSIPNEWFVCVVKNDKVEITTKNDKADTYQIFVNTIDSYDGGVSKVFDKFNFFIADGTLANPYQIRSTSDFEYFLRERNKNLSGKHFVISTDIYLNKSFNDSIYRGENTYYQTFLNKPLNNYLSGRFDPLHNGDYYNRTVYGLNINLNNVDSSMNIGLFSELSENIIVRYLALDNVVINITTSSDNFDLNIGGIVGVLGQGKLIGCKVNGSISVRVNDNNIDDNAEINIGGIVGSYSGGQIMSIPDEGMSVNNSDINSTINIEYVSNAKANLGGIAGKMCNVSLIDVRAIANIVTKNLEQDNYGESNIGGVVGTIVGLSDQNGAIDTKVLIDNVISYPSIVGQSNIGGLVGSIVGSLNNVTIKNSQVQLLYNINMKNVVAGFNNVGGIIGTVENNVTNLQYVYVRSYGTKEINTFNSDRNKFFYLDYSLKYYGSVVLLNDSGNPNASVGGLIGKGYTNIKNCNFTSNVVSFNSNANFGGVVGNRNNYDILIKSSYVDAKLLYYDEINRKFHNSFNIITKADSSEQSISETDAVSHYMYSGTLSSEKNSYITITRTKTYNNSIANYTDKINGLSLNTFYAKVNNSLFGIINNTNNTELSFRGFSDKVEKLTLIVYNTGSGIRIYARNEIFENTPSGATYNNYILSNTNSVEMWSSDDVKELASMNVELAQQLISLGIFDSNNNTRNYLQGRAISTEYEAEDIVSDSLKCCELFKNIGSLSIEDGDEVINVLDKIADKCTVEITNNLEDNRSLFKVVKTITANVSNVKFYNNSYKEEYEEGPNSATPNNFIFPRIEFVVNDNTYTFTTTFAGYSRSEDWQNEKGQVMLLIEQADTDFGILTLQEDGEINSNLGSYNNIFKEGDVVYYNNAKGHENEKFVLREFKLHRLDCEFDAEGKVTNVEKIEDEEVTYLFNYDKDRIFAMGRVQLVYLESAFNIDENGRVENNYTISGENIYDENNNVVTSDLETYYGIFYDLYLTAGNIDVTNNQILELYSDKGASNIKDLFTGFGFTSIDGEVVQNYDGNNYYQYGNSWFVDDTFADEIVKVDVNNELQNVANYSVEQLVEILESKGVICDDEMPKDELLQLLQKALNLENERVKLILNQLTDKKENSTYNSVEIAYYKDGEWYSSPYFGLSRITDKAILNQLAGKYENSLYYDKKTISYNDSDYAMYFLQDKEYKDGSIVELNDNNKTLVELDLSPDDDFKSFLQTEIGENYATEVYFWYDENDRKWFYKNNVGLEGPKEQELSDYLSSLFNNEPHGTNNITVKIYASRWKEEISENNYIYIDDHNILNQLGDKRQDSSYNITKTAYYRNNWYSDIDYTQKVSNDLITNIQNAYQNDDTISKQIDAFEIVIGNNACVVETGNLFIDGDGEPAIETKKAIATYINDGGITDIKVEIIDNVVYIVKTNPNNVKDYQDLVIDTINISGQTYYVIGKGIMSNTNIDKWLITDKINSNLPVTLQHNYNVSLSYDLGSFINGSVIANYKLYYDELATLVLNANEFVKNDNSEGKNPNGDYIYVDSNGNKEHGHLKLDNNSVILMYNELKSGASNGEENIYELAFGEQDGHYVATLNGIVVDLSAVEIDKDSALQLIVTSNNSGIINIERQTTTNNFNVIVRGEGQAEISFYNLKDDSIKVTLNVYTIKGFTNFVVKDNIGRQTYTLDTIVGGDPSDYTFNFINELVQDVEYEANNGGFKLKLLEIDGISNSEEFNNPDINYSIIKINNNVIDKSAFANDKLEFYFETPNLSFVAINRNNSNDPDNTSLGSFKFEITPFIMCNGQQIFVQQLSKEVIVKISNPAQMINFTETDHIQSPEEEKTVTVRIYSNYDNEILILEVSGDDFDKEYYEIDGSNYSVITKSDSLLKFRLHSISCEPVTLDGVVMYLYTYEIVFGMNFDEYRIQTSNTGVNAIAIAKDYTLVAYPKSHCKYKKIKDAEYEDQEVSPGESVSVEISPEVWGYIPEDGAISSSYEFSIVPVKANTMDTNFYPYLTPYKDGEATDDVNGINAFALKQIYDIRSLPPGYYGLLKIDITPKFNNALVVQLEIDKQYVGYITFQQIVPDPSTDELFGYYKKLVHNRAEGDMNVENITVLWDVPYVTNTPPADLTPDELNSWAGEWIYSEYYVAVHISENCPQGINIPITIKAFDETRNQLVSDIVDIMVEPIPLVTISIDGTDNVIKGINEYIPLQITAENVDRGALIIDTNGLDLYTFDGKEYKIHNSNVIDPAVQYYVYSIKPGVDVGDSMGVYTIGISTSRNIHGEIVSSASSVRLQIVWFTLESLHDRDEINGVITMKTGMYKGLSISASVSQGFTDYISSLSDEAKSETNPGIKEDLENEIASLKQLKSNFEKEVAGRGSYDKSYWYYNNNDTNTYLNGSQLFTNFVFGRYEAIENSNEESFFRISAITTGNVGLRLNFHYEYLNGIIKLYDQVEANNALLSDHTKQIFAYEYDFVINIKENSSEDHPIPIYTAEDLMKMEKGVNYILQSDITLNNWKPMEFNAKYLDGNGFIITINSYDMTELKGKEEVYAGIFTKIVENSIIKNVTINVSNLLYNDNALTDVRNGINKPNIDLRETPIVYFGVLAGENSGIIINTKIVNTSALKDNNTLYVGISRDYFTYDGESTLSMGYVGGLVASNIGSITNSFIGQNNSEKIERTTIVGTANTFGSAFVYIYPFAIEACNNVGGMVYFNGGTITNSYIKSISINNNARISDNSSTAGFVANNSGKIYSCAVSTNEIENFKSKGTTIKSSSITGGFVYINSGVIEDCYTNIQINNQTVETAGFVYDNSDGSIKNCYTTTKNKSITHGSGNTHSHGLFIYNKDNHGIIENSYYLIFNKELGDQIDDPEADAEVLRSLDPAVAIIKNTGEEVSRGEFNGFNFASTANSHDGVWYWNSDNASYSFPELAYAENVDYFTIRSLTNIDKTTFDVDVTASQVSVVISHENEEVDRYDTLSRKTNVWYFNNSNYMFEVVGGVIIEINSNSEMEIIPFVDGNNTKNSYFKFTYPSTGGQEYIVYYDDNDSNGYRVKIGASEKRFANYSFTYMGYEFIVIKSGTDIRMMTSNGYSMVEVTCIDTTNNKFEYGSNSTYTYMCVKNNLGTKFNPLIVTNSEEFAKYIVNNTNEYVLQDGSRKYIFGLVENGGDGVYARYVHLASDINFRNDEDETDKNIAASYEVNNSTTKKTINDVIFNGVLIGNSMSINNIILNSTQVAENYGIFSEVGVNDAIRYELNQIGITDTYIGIAQVINLKLQYLELSNTSANKVGLLAGTISNAIVNKIDIVGVDQIGDESRIIGQNLVGSLAGLIYGDDDKTRISEITVTNANVLSTVNQLSNLNEATVAVDQSYSAFKDSEGATTTQVRELSFQNYKDTIIREVANLKNALYAPSYAGAVAGAIVMDTKILDSYLCKNGFNNYYSYKKLREYADNFYITDILVKGTINIQADISGGIAGYMGAQYEHATNEYGLFASKLKVELSDGIQQNIYGYAYAGGIVGQSENAYFMETTVSHAEEIQDELDKNINKLTSEDVSDSYLFSKEMDNSKYNIAIGGIVGRMSDTWIVDSYSKANIENKNSFIAGGLVGFATDRNYLAYVYSTGNILARNMIGGLVGYYYNSTKSANGSTDYDLNMYNAFAVNIWNSSIKDLLKVNEKAYKYEAIIEDVLTDVSLLTKEQLAEHKLSITPVNSMPELGNQQLSASVNDGSQIVGADGKVTGYNYKISVNTEYRGFASYERFTYIGSVLGRYSYNKDTNNQELLEDVDFFLNFNSIDQTNKIVGNSNITSSNIIDAEEYYTYYADKSFNVISSTYGMVEHDGSIEEGDYESKILEDKINLSYFESVYDNVEENAGVVVVDGYNVNNINNFAPIFGKQYYISYITGDFINNVVPTGIEEIVGNRVYSNEFTSLYGFTHKVEKLTNVDDSWTPSTTVDNLYLSKANLNALKNIHGYDPVTNSLTSMITGFGPSVSNIWYVDNGYYLPKYGHNTNITFGLVNDEDSLIEALTLGKPGMMYRIDKNNDHIAGATIKDCGLSGSSDDYTYHVIARNASQLQLGNSEINLNNNFYYAPNKVTILIKIDPNAGNGFANVFNVISNCTFMNIEFRIDLTDVISYGSALQTRNIEEGNLGFFANIINSSVFTNCRFEFIFDGEINLSGTGGIEGAIKSMGIVVGRSHNSTFMDCGATVIATNTGNSTINLGKSQVAFGGFAGSSFQTVFKNTNLANTGLVTINYNGDADEFDHSIGGYVGSAQYSRFESITHKLKMNFEAVDLDGFNYNVGLFIGSAISDTSMKSIEIFNTSSGANFKFSGNPTSTANTGIIGSATNIAEINNIKVKKIPIIISNVNTNYGVFGKAQAGSRTATISNILVDADDSYFNVEFGYTGNEEVAVNVGSIIGFKSSNSTIEINECINNENLNITFNTSKPNISVGFGGMVGTANGISIDKCVNLGNMDLLNSLRCNVKFGGFVGGNASGSVSINNSINYGDQEFNLTDSNICKVGGVVGDMGRRTINLSYVMALGNLINYATSSGVTSKDSINGIANNYNYLSGEFTHYVAEHDPRHAYNTSLGYELNYKIDNLEKSYAWQYIDVYQNYNKKVQAGEIEEGATLKLVDDEECLIEWSGNNTLPKVVIPTNDQFDYEFSNELGSKFNPKSSIGANTGEYVIIDDEYDLVRNRTTFTQIQEGTIVTSTNKEGQILYVTSEKHISENYGTISNIIFEVNNDDVLDERTTFTTNARIIDNNYGYLVNVGFKDNGFAVVNSDADVISPIHINKGGIYASGSMLLFRKEAWRTTAVIKNGARVSFIAYSNTNIGEISDVYTTSTLTAKCNGTITFGAIAHNNYGTIKNVYSAVSVMILNESDQVVDAKLNVAGHGNVYSSEEGSTLEKSKSSKTLKNGNLKPSQIKALAGEDGTLAKHLWEIPEKTGINYNSGYPVIKGGIKLFMSFLNNEVITSIERLNEWIYQGSLGKTFAIGYGVIIDITKIIDADTVIGTITENKTGATIKINNLTTDGGIIKFFDEFVTTNKGTITSVSNTTIKNLQFISDKDGTYFIQTNDEGGVVSLGSMNANGAYVGGFTGSRSNGFLGTYIFMGTNNGNLTLAFDSVAVESTFIGINIGNSATLYLKGMTIDNYIVTTNASELNLYLNNVTLDSGVVSENRGSLNFNALTKMTSDIAVYGGNYGSINFQCEEAIKSNIEIGANAGLIKFWATTDEVQTSSINNSQILIGANSGTIEFATNKDVKCASIEIASNVYIPDDPDTTEVDEETRGEIKFNKYTATSTARLNGAVSIGANNGIVTFDYGGEIKNGVISIDSIGSTGSVAFGGTKISSNISIGDNNGSVTFNASEIKSKDISFANNYGAILLRSGEMFKNASMELVCNVGTISSISGTAILDNSSISMGWNGGVYADLGAVYNSLIKGFTFKGTNAVLNIVNNYAILGEVGHDYESKKLYFNEGATLEIGTNYSGSKVRNIHFNDSNFEIDYNYGTIGANDENADSYEDIKITFTKSSLEIGTNLDYIQALEFSDNSEMKVDFNGNKYYSGYVGSSSYELKFNNSKITVNENSNIEYNLSKINHIDLENRSELIVAKNYNDISDIIANDSLVEIGSNSNAYSGYAEVFGITATDSPIYIGTNSSMSEITNITINGGNFTKNFVGNNYGTISKITIDGTTISKSLIDLNSGYAGYNNKPITMRNITSSANSVLLNTDDDSGHVYAVAEKCTLNCPSGSAGVIAPVLQGVIYQANIKGCAISGSTNNCVGLVVGEMKGPWAGITTSSITIDGITTNNSINLSNGTNVGGIFGSVSYSNTASISSNNIEISVSKGSNIGGVIGQYLATSGFATNGVIANNSVSISVGSEGSTTNVGGCVGNAIVASNTIALAKSYTSNVSINIMGKNVNNIGGVFGYLLAGPASIKTSQYIFGGTIATNDNIKITTDWGDLGDGGTFFLDQLSDKFSTMDVGDMYIDFDNDYSSNSGYGYTNYTMKWFTYFPIVQAIHCPSFGNICGKLEGASTSDFINSSITGSITGIPSCQVKVLEIKFRFVGTYIQQNSQDAGLFYSAFCATMSTWEISSPREMSMQMYIHNGDAGKGQLGYRNEVDSDNWHSVVMSGVYGATRVSDFEPVEAIQIYDGKTFTEKCLDVNGEDAELVKFDGWTSGLNNGKFVIKPTNEAFRQSVKTRYKVKI